MKNQSPLIDIKSPLIDIKRLFIILIVIVPFNMRGHEEASNIFRTLNSSSGLPDNFILGITSDNEGYIYIATKEGICRYDGHNTFAVSNSDALANPQLSMLATIDQKQHKSTKKTFIDRSGKVWIYDVYGNGLECYQTGRKYFGNTIIKEIAEDDYGNLWIATNNEGLIILNTESSRWRTLTHSAEDKYSIPSNHLTCVHIDSISQSVWVGTSEHGIGITSVRPLEITYKNLGIPHNVSSFAFLDSTTMIVAFDGGGIYDTHSRQIDTPSKVITNILYDRKKDSTIIATYGSGLFSLSGDKCTQIEGCEADSPMAFSRHLMIDSEDCLWIGTYSNGLFRRQKDGKIEQFTSEKSGIGSNCIVGIGQYRDTIYCASTSGVYKTSLSDIVPEQIETSGTSEIKAFAVGNDGSKWIAGKNTIITPDNENISIPDIKAIAIDQSGRCWVTASAGLFCIERRPTDRCKLLQFSSLLGIAPESFSKYALRSSPEGMMYASTFGGYLKFDPERLVGLSTSQIQVSEFTITGKKSLITDINVLEPGDTLGISLTSLDYLFPENERFAWRMLPDSALHNITENKLIIGNIKPGKHTLQIIELNTDNKIDIKIVQKRSMRWLWLAISLTILTAATAFAFYRLYYIRKRRASIGDMAPADRTFLQNVDELINKELSNPDFSVEEFAARMSMSRSLLYKKLSALTGRSPLEYLRDRRIERGKELLDEGHNIISQVAYSVGFSPKQFARFFKEKYNVLPSEYIRK